ALGPPSRLQVSSTAYGTITVWLTGSAAVLLVVLAAHRVVRRVRGEPNPRDRTGPSVGPPTPGPPTPGAPTDGPPTSGPPHPEPVAVTPPVMTDMPTAPVRASDPEPPTTPVRTPPDPEPPTRPVPARRP
ncbi:MAG TPA: hypothetical protein VFY38_15990, partial [Pseudonocardia sp.]|nr:hypothetical protein [Pseudonocardia sp.]